MKKLVMMGALAAMAWAQEPTKTQDVQVFQMRTPAPEAGVTSDRMFVFQNGGPLPAIERMPLKAMKGAPYSAETTTETVQTLADGNRITTKQTAKVWRDGEGRTRQEMSILPTGFWTPEGKNVTITTINDPVSGKHYVVNNSESGSGSTLGTVRASASANTSSSGLSVIQFDSKSAGTKHVSVTASGSGVAHEMPSKSAKTESLGVQVIEGVQCDGVRETTTIPAGQIGNERPIEIVTERWTSKELGIDVLRKYADPRSGETTYKVTNIQRVEPLKSLFEIPAGESGDVVLEKVVPDGVERHITVRKPE